MDITDELRNLKEAIALIELVAKSIAARNCADSARILPTLDLSTETAQAALVFIGGVAAIETHSPVNGISKKNH